MNTVLAIVVIAGLAIAIWRWYQSAIRKWTWQAVEKICMGARIRLVRRYQARYPPDAATRIASAVIARLLPLEEGLPFTWNTLGMARDAPAATGPRPQRHPKASGPHHTGLMAQEHDASRSAVGECPLDRHSHRTPDRESHR